MGVAIGHGGMIEAECPQCQGAGWDSLEEACGVCYGRGKIVVKAAGSRPMILLGKPEVLRMTEKRKLDEDDIATLILELRRGMPYRALCDRFGITAGQLAAYRANETRGAYDEHGYTVKYDPTGKPIKRTVKGIRKRLTPEQQREKIAAAFDAIGIGEQ